MSHEKRLILLNCNSNIKLANDIALALNLNLTSSKVLRFSDGEINVVIEETVRDADVFIIQSTSPPVNDNLMELLIMSDAVKRASASSINAVIPYFGYARQDRKTRARDPISAKLVSDIITCAGANRILTMDLHCEQIQGFFDIPVDNLSGAPIFVNYFKNKFQKDFKNITIVSPDFGSVTRARFFANKLNMPLAIIDKRRSRANMSEILNVIGCVKNRIIIMLDDMIDTAGTITNAANELKRRGAIKICVCCTHALLSGEAINKINNSAIDELVALDTIFIPENKKFSKLKIISVANIFATAIKHVHQGLSVSGLFG
ncbi:MAG: ribose-phosphate pyrophosphokinase [Clostridiales bacterium]|jgi:ribose-phosphate pyrophosphokinase|nr:ribose-phosphate pyrophosphokinase [Clostridiales bacterium]